jgi:hypothetical protein
MPDLWGGAGLGAARGVRPAGDDGRGPLGTRACERCGHREDFGEECGYGEKAEAEWELEQFPGVAYLWLDRFGPEPRFFDEDDAVHGPDVTTDA